MWTNRPSEPILECPKSWRQNSFFFSLRFLCIFLPNPISLAKSSRVMSRKVWELSHLAHISHLCYISLFLLLVTFGLRWSVSSFVIFLSSFLLFTLSHTLFVRFSISFSQEYDISSLAIFPSLPFSPSLPLSRSLCLYLSLYLSRIWSTMLKLTIRGQSEIYNIYIYILYNNSAPHTSSSTFLSSRYISLSIYYYHWSFFLFEFNFPSHDPFFLMSESGWTDLYQNYKNSMIIIVILIIICFDNHW